MTFRPAGPVSVSSMRLSPCIAAFRKAKCVPATGMFRPLRLKFTVMFLAMLEASWRLMPWSSAAL